MAVEAIATNDLDPGYLLPAHEDMEDLDYVPEDHDLDVSLHADSTDPDELIDLLNAVNPDTS
jgi:hypothetical protein